MTVRRDGSSSTSPAFEHRRARRAVAAGEGPRARHQLGEAERFGEVVVGAEGEAADEVVDAAGRRQHQHLGVRTLGGEGAADVVAVHVREVTVEHHDVIGGGERLAQGGLAVAREVDRHALAAQPARDRVAHPGLVLGDQHAHALYRGARA